MNNLPDTKVTIDEDGNESYENQDSGEMSGSGTGGGSSDEISDEQFEDLLSSIENGELKAEPNEPKEEEVEVDEDKNLLTPQQQKQFSIQIKKQKKFMDGEVQKKNVTYQRRVSWKLLSQVVWDMSRLVKDLPIGMVKK